MTSNLTEVVSFRMGRALRERLSLVASVEGVDDSDLIRTAVDNHLNALLASTEFRDKVEGYLAAQRNKLFGEEADDGRP